MQQMLYEQKGIKTQLIFTDINQLYLYIQGFKRYL
jgi:hypothetical protein